MVPAWSIGSAPMVPERWVGQARLASKRPAQRPLDGHRRRIYCLNADLVTALPEHVSFAEGATLGVPGMTAHGCVFVAGAGAGTTVLVTGAAGAVGHYAVQLAAGLARR